MNEAGYATFHCGKAGNACTFSNAAFQTNITMAETLGRLGHRVPATTPSSFSKNHDGTKPFFMYMAPPVPHDPRLAPERVCQSLRPGQGDPVEELHAGASLR